MSCIDAPHAVGTLGTPQLDAPHAVGCRPGRLDCPHAVGTPGIPEVDAPHAIGTRAYALAFWEIWVRGPVAVDESGISGGPGDGTGGFSGPDLLGSGS